MIEFALYFFFIMYMTSSVVKLVYNLHGYKYKVIVSIMLSIAA